MSEDVKPYGAPALLNEEPTVEELRALIATTGLSQRRAAEAIDISERMMRYYASGKERIPRAVLYAMRYLASTTKTLPTDRDARQLYEAMRKQIEADKAAGRSTIFEATSGELNRLVRDVTTHGGTVSLDGDGLVHLETHGIAVRLVDPPAPTA